MPAEDGISWPEDLWETTCFQGEGHGGTRTKTMRRKTEPTTSSGEWRLYATARRSGLIADISPEGLAFHYIDRKRWPAEDDTLTICSDANDFTLAGIPYTVTSDQPVKHQKDPALVVKRMGLSFGALSPEQEEQLNYLLQLLYLISTKRS